MSDRVFQSRRRPGIVISATLAVVAFALLAVGARLPGPFLVLLALVAGTAAFGGVGLYLTLVAELGGARYAGSSHGPRGRVSWSGVLIGPPLFGALLEGTGRWETAWLVFAVLALGVALVLPRPRPLVERS